MRQIYLSKSLKRLIN